MADVSNNNVLSYPTMTRQRADKIQAKEIAYAEDVNAEFDHIVDTYNRLVLLLTGEWGDGTGRIYDLVDNAVSLANSAIAKANGCVQKSGDTMTGQLNIALVPSSDYNVVNKKYVDDTIDAELSGPVNRIQQLEDWKENLNATQVKLDNVNFASNNVNDGMNELFISVSSGKATVAAAITGKGIQTASDASFKQMADNINAILTFNEGTAGGTATAADIMYGKTAYARGGLIVGNYIPLDLSDATATSDKILEGYTAYVGGGKIIGTYVPPREYPVYGTDTSNATATEADIMYGKTAYARGQLLTGTMRNTEVEEIYGINADSLNLKELSLMKTDPITKETITRNLIAFSKNNKYCVSATTVNGVKYIESYAINEKGLYVQQSSSIGGNVTTKKYRYTYSELGLEENENIVDIAFSCSGVRNVATDCYLILLTGIYSSTDKNYHFKVRVYTYHLKENGVIGKEYDNQLYIVENANDEVYSTPNPNDPNYKLVTPNLKDNMFFVAGVVKTNIIGQSGYHKVYKYTIFELTDGVSLSKTTFTGDTDKEYYEVPEKIYFTNDDKYAMAQQNSLPYYIFTVDSNYNPSFMYDNINDITLINIPNKNVFLGTSSSTINVYQAEFTESQNKPTITSLKSISVNYQDKLNYTKTLDIVNGLAMIDNKTLLAIALSYESINGDYGYRRAWVITLDIGEILNAESGSSVEIKSAQQLPYVYNLNSTEYPIVPDINYTNIFIKYGTTALFRVSQEVDVSDIIGVKYKDKIFYALDYRQLTAIASDVKQGKTFIGSKGVPEMGTMEV